MPRTKPRALAAASLVLALQLLAAAPGWLTAMAWLGRLLTRTAGQQPAAPAADTVGPLTGSCIDPQGIKPCGQ